MQTLSENIIVIHDVEPNHFAIWLFMMCVILILYFIVATIHDIRREDRLEKLKEEIEAERERKHLEKF